MENNKSLYRISMELTEILAQIDELDGEITPEIDAALSINQEQAVTKMADYGLAILQLKGMEEQAKNEADRITKLRKAYANTADRLEAKVLEAMRLFGLNKIDTATLKMSTHTSVRTIIDDVELIPKAYKTVKVETVADKTAIKKAIQSGEEVGGAHLEENTTLQIK